MGTANTATHNTSDTLIVYECTFSQLSKIRNCKKSQSAVCSKSAVVTSNKSVITQLHTSPHSTAFIGESQYRAPENRRQPVREITGFVLLLAARYRY
jgi:hypothetical protein